MQKKNKKQNCEIGITECGLWSSKNCAGLAIQTDTVFKNQNLFERIIKNIVIWDWNGLTSEDWILLS